MKKKGMAHHGLTLDEVKAMYPASSAMFEEREPAPERLPYGITQEEMKAMYPKSPGMWRGKDQAGGRGSDGRFRPVAEDSTAAADHANDDDDDDDDAKAATSAATKQRGPAVLHGFTLEELKAMYPNSPDMWK